MAIAQGSPRLNKDAGLVVIGNLHHRAASANLRPDFHVRARLLRSVSWRTRTQIGCLD
jgi:hypothetical protein